MNRTDSGDTRWIAACSLALIAALWAVGVASSEPLRHFVQSSPIWLAVVLGMRRIALAKWIAFPFFIIWLCIMTFIWLFLLGWAHIVSGHFSPVETALTFVIGIVCLLGIASCIRRTTTTGALTATAIFVLSFMLQVAALWLSLRPQIEHR